ncbi:MAG TPA: MmgE/PrpD family protein [Burkholderiaceae bacterium]|jgi:2-methylcitrate dehydratase PrpD
MTTTTTAQLARFALATRADDIPPAVQRSAKLLMLDTIGCALGAVDTAEGRAVRAIVARHGSGPATVLGTGQSASVSTAAWANGRLGNILDIDECYKVQGHHAQASLGAALALAESGAMDGRALLSAFTLGFEVGVRLGNFLSPRVTVDEHGRTKGWTGLVGPGQGVHAACTATARLLGADEKTLANGFGLCAQYMVGRDWSRQWGRDADLGTIKYADTGWNAQGGMMAAFHALEGVTGVRDIFDTDSYAQVFQGVVLNPAAMLEQLGTRWYLPETSIKFWPCCRWIHYALTAYADIVATHGLRADEIDAVELLSFPMIPYPRFGDRGDPPNLVAATFSFPHAAAMIALGVPAGPAWFEPSAMSGEAARAMRAKVSLGIDEVGYDPATWGLAQGELKVPSHARVRARGRLFEARSDYALGDSWRGAPRFGEAEVIAKFKRLARSAAATPERADAAIERIVDSVLGVDALSDVRALTAAISALR